MLFINRRFLAILRKEAIHIRRDPRTMFVALLFPVIMMILYGYGIRFDVRHLPFMVLDMDRSPFSRHLIQALANNRHFSYRGSVLTYRQLERALDVGRARIGLVFPPGAGRRSTQGTAGPPVQVILDGSDANAANIALGYLAAFGQRMAEEEKAAASPGRPLLDIQPRVWYNTELRSANFVVPGIIAIIMILLGTLLTAFTLVEEKERGTVEMLIVSPLTKLELILGKILPYLAISLVDVIIIVIMGYLLFGVPIKGSLWLLLLTCLLYLFTVLGLGILISSFTRKLQDAMFLAFVTTLLPGILLSGFVFPLESLPAAIKPLSYFVPTRYFLIIIRGIYLKGVGPAVLWRQMLALALFGLFLVLASALRFRKSLE